MSDQSAHHRLYDALRQRLAGTDAKGTGRISPGRLADERRVSITPVREVLFRLAGERLVDLHPDGGFSTAHLNAATLADLYAWNGYHLLAALHLLSEGVVASVVEANGSVPLRRHQDVVGRIEALFAAIGRATGNEEFVMQVQAANDRLRRARLVEGRLFADTGNELRSMVRRVVSDAKSNVRRRVHAYHRRRVEHAGQIAALLAESWPDVD